MPQAMDEVAQLADKIKADHSSPELDLAARALAMKYGDWVCESIVDKLTNGEKGMYSQHEEDFKPAAFSLSAFSLRADVPDLDMIEFLGSLIPKDFNRISREAHLSRVEKEVWNYWIRDYTINQIQRIVLRADDEMYSLYGLRKILGRAKRKVYECPSMGWRTALAEDRHRGRFAVPPLRVSWLEVCSDDGY